MHSPWQWGMTLLTAGYRRSLGFILVGKGLPSPIGRGWLSFCYCGKREKKTPAFTCWGYRRCTGLRSPHATAPEGDLSPMPKQSGNKVDIPPKIGQVKSTIPIRRKRSQVLFASQWDRGCILHKSVFRLVFLHMGMKDDPGRLYKACPLLPISRVDLLHCKIFI